MAKSSSLTKAAREDQIQQVREAAENDLETFIRVVHPQRVLGSVHKELIRWWDRDEAKSHQIVLLPRDHGKSALVAYRVAQAITKNPALRVLYISSTANLAEKQLKFIKDILTSDRYRFYWPDHVHPEEGKREKWTTTEIALDHPLRKIEAIRDPSIFVGGLTTGMTGMHCDIAVLDDVVVKENAYTQEGRDKVASQYSLLASIESADAREWIVGTRYHPKDLYNDLLTKKMEVYDNEGEIIDEVSLYEIFERQVENRGDGTGEFLWPRQQRYDGKWFGFDISILAKKRAQYIDRTQFRAQYYNDPNDIENATISSSLFQYYDREQLSRLDGKWYLGRRRLAVYASVDFAYSLSKRSDYTCIVVVGVDPDKNYYVLDIDRFKTDKISEYFSHILTLFQKWDFRKIRCEVTSAQSAIVSSLKQDYIARHNIPLSVDEFKPNRYMGTKEERVESILQPKYANGQIWHFRGGNCQTLEEELVLSNPPHDDVKDCLASVVDMAIAPPNTHRDAQVSRFSSHSRFGGVTG